MNNLELLTISLEKIKTYLQNNDDSSAPVVNFQKPSELKEIIDFPVKHKGISELEFLELLDNYLNFSVKTGNKQFLNQLYAGFNLPAFIGELFTTLANTSMYTYEVAPVASLIETEMIQLMNRYAGYPNGDGIFVSGGSNANLMAMFSARNQTYLKGKYTGYNQNLKLKAFVSDQAHYSFETAANVLGIGADNIIKVATDKNGRLIPDALEREIVTALKRGDKPFFVAATCATTLLGAFDPIDEMAEICKKYNIWLHADGSFGGSVLLSEQHRHLMKGIEKTDSLAWNAHKLMNIPLMCSVFLVKKRGILQQNITEINTDYIYHDKNQMEDLGKKSIQCGRRVDAVKLWFAWKYYGMEGYQKRIDHLIDMASYAESIVKNNSQLELLSERQSFSICFRYNVSTTDLNTFNLMLRESLRKKGKSLVNYGFIGETLAIRLVTVNSELNRADIDLFFENILSEAQKLENINLVVNDEA